MNQLPYETATAPRFMPGPIMPAASDPANRTARLLDPAFLKRLELLSLAMRRPVAGQMKGEKRSVKRGSSIEFADYREYLPGDDLRYVDWNTAARLGRMYLKLFVEEEDLFLALLVDTSRSMGFGEPTKLEFAARIAASLGYIGLANYDRVLVQPYAESLTQPLPPQRGKAGAAPLFRCLETLSPEGRTSLDRSLTRFAAATKQRGLAVLLSDLLDPGWQAGLKALLARGHQVAVVHVLSPDELHPDLTGDLRIIDSETGAATEMSVSPQLLARYHAALDAFCVDAASVCRRYGVDYLRASSADSWEDTVLKALRRIGLIG